MSLIEQIDSDSLIPPIEHPLLKRFSRPSVYRWLLKGKLRGIRIGNSWFTTPAWVNEFVEMSSAPRTQHNRLLEVKAAEVRMASRRLGNGSGPNSRTQ